MSTERTTATTTWGAARAKSLAAQVKAFTATVGGLGARVSTIAAKLPAHAKDEDPVEVLQLEHEALLVAEEELRVQLDELEAAEACIQAERARYDAVFHAAPDGYAITDGYGVVEEANPAMARLLAIDPKFLLKKPLASFVAGRDGARFREVLAMGPTAPPSTELELAVVPRRSEQPRACAVAVSVLPSERGRRLFWRFRDPRAVEPTRAPSVPPPSDVEDASLETLAELRETVERERAARVTHELASRAKDHLLELASHDLRGPLHSVLGWARLMKGGHRDPLRERAIAAIERSGKAQLAIIDDLLDIAHIATGTFDVEQEPLDLGAIVSDVVDALQSRASAAAIDLRWHVPEVRVDVRGDEKRLHQVITKLLENALKFTPAGGSVRVSLACQAGRDAVLCVRDSGRGVEGAALPEIFDAFAREHHARRGREGLGLSLHIVRHIVQRHGGSIHAQSDGPGRGAVFTVQLPLERKASSSSAAPSAARLDLVLRGVEILVVCEDDETNELLALELRRHSAAVSVARDESSALALFDATCPDAVVVDVSANPQRGAAFVRAMRARLHGDVPVVALSPSSLPSEIGNIVDAGVDAHIGKPFEAAELVAVVAEAIRKRE